MCEGVAHTEWLSVNSSWCCQWQEAARVCVCEAGCGMSLASTVEQMHSSLWLALKEPKLLVVKARTETAHFCKTIMIHLLIYWDFFDWGWCLSVPLKMTAKTLLTFSHRTFEWMYCIRLFYCAFRYLFTTWPCCCFFAPCFTRWATAIIVAS